METRSLSISTCEPDGSGRYWTKPVMFGGGNPRTLRMDDQYNASMAFTFWDWWANAMNIRRVVPDIKADHIDESRDFYADFLGFQVGMDMGWVITFVSPSNPTAQLTVFRDDDSGNVQPQITIEVEDVDRAHAKAVERSLEIVYPLTIEPWGVKRFFVTDPNGIVLNVMSHLKASP
jgi:catechol 2,3-dioxygenase-like lactoylglutathione lyase family enzyme